MAKPPELPIGTTLRDAWDIAWTYEADGLWHDHEHGRAMPPGSVPEPPPVVDPDQP